MLVVAGGGAGGGWQSSFNGGGGGAGGLVYNSNIPLSTTNYTITVGAGGAGVSGAQGTNGSNSSIIGAINYTAIGGGAGGSGNAGNSGNAGGSGGGGAGLSSSGGTGGVSIQNSTFGYGVGFAGGTGLSSFNAAGGGGSANAGTTGASAYGGIGTAYNFANGTSVYYAGGGSGAGTVIGGNLGGGGSAPGGAGANNTGGGGGGSASGAGGNGGSGTVIVSYPLPQYFTGGVVTNNNGANVVHTFNTSGTLTGLTTPIDTYQPYNTLLLHADGTSGANNSSFLDSGISNTYIPFPGTYSYYFNGTYYLTNATSTAATFGLNDFTIEYFVYYTTIVSSGNESIFGNGTTNNGFGYGLNANNLSYTTQSAGRTSSNTSGRLVGNTWYHVAFTRKSGNVNVFLNGTLSFAQGQDAVNLTETGIGLGAVVGGQTPTYGYVSNFRVINGAALYTTNFTPPTSALSIVSNTTCNTTLLTCQSPYIVDNSQTPVVFVPKGPVPITAGGSAIMPFGTPTQGTFSPYATTGWSNYFNGSSSYLSYSTSASLQFGANNFTMEGWINSPNISSGISIMCSHQTGGMFLLSSAAGGYLSLSINTSAGASTNYTTLTCTSTPLANNNWYHFAFVRNGTTLYAFVNGIQDATTASMGANIVGSYGGPKPLYLGAGGDAASFYTGYLSNVRFINGTALYTGNFTPPSTQLTSIANTVATTNFLGGYSNSFKDGSVSSYTVSIGGGTPQVQPFSPFNPTVVYSNTVVGGSIYLGGSDYMNLPSPGTTYQFGTNNWTIEAWIYPTSTSSSQVIFLIYGNTNDVIAIEYNGTTKAPFGDIRGTNQAEVFPVSTVLAPLYSWSHLVLTRDSTTTVKIYVNGQLGVTQTIAATTTFVDTQYTGSPSTPIIGAKTNTLGNQFTGYISGLRVVSNSAIYSAPFTPPTSPPSPVANTVLLLNATNAGIIDSSQKVNLVAYGSAAISTTQSKFGGSSMYFNGTTDYIQATVPAPGTGDFTLEGWVYLPAFSTGSPNIFSIVASGSSTGFQVYVTSTVYGIRSNVANFITYTGGIPSLNVWNHVAIVRYSGTITLYVNGINVGSTSTAYTLSDTQFNAGNTPIGQYLNAYIDEIRYTKGYARYTANFTPPTSAFLNT
jgi:hypothetical protein